ncbi:hypothetical protein BUN12_0066 [Bacillus amyloliquefaciens]|jgi:hypothetical protein|uniref:Uncharacterized protein n=1 Tax=Bacillus amyloliquefaciens (strain ATCC 23350 / DSM 7 / BCRC 11601 / CCUG 28519 / NBRC 15535 / NRRL B-14393 / F) TaxID=692420 RepID=A0A9P1JF44_BACAS|nr:hypothetical protein [Bacillus amyloliquefaciens]AZV88330.1 hypothetical protein BUN12_0066 [Bacillus amyloliquefaciens]MEC1838055.1 hypothetical protein [Bacillus amyloliquefaciens]MEC1846823.1 hypothetical protein [Bacillus amyloliquefaciens]MEC1930516.1 hypothetical protein [Bacillus amyloliquefaciens]MEC2021084.1 hypothetical protein [Bacillus amyloliquefaciens]
MVTKKYVRIKKAKSSDLAYSVYIGRVFTVIDENENEYILHSVNVLKEDAELIVTEKRKAAVGERVLLTAPTNTKGKYLVGDVFTVRESGETGVRVDENEFMTLWHKEYEVIVNSEVKNEEADEMKIDLNAMGYDELLAHGDAVMEAIKKRTFQEGFQAAKQVQRKLAKMKTSINTQARRDEIVEQAKADVEKLANKYGYYYAYGRNTKAEFIVNCEKRTVVTILRWIADGQIVARGIAKAAPSDCFNVHIGRAIALRRALGLTVPDEYLNAPQPTEVRVGDVVRGKYADYYYQLCREGELGDDSYEAKIREIADGKYRYVGGGYDFIDNADLTIIDDSREEVCE